MEIQDLVKPPITAHDWKYLVLHHSGLEGGSVETLDALHRQRKDQFGSAWPGIGYHFVVGNGHGMPDGQIEPTFRWKEQLHGAHVRSRRHNRHGIGICLIGDFDATSPTPRQGAALERLCVCLMQRYGIETNKVLRHMDVAATRCPGRLFPLSELMESFESELVTP